VLVAAAVCPHPPLLVPELASGAASEMHDVRERCQAAVKALIATAPDLLAVIGADVGPRSTSFAPWGADVRVDVPEPLPLPLLVGGWLTRGVVRSFVAVAPDLDPAECATLGAELATAANRVALLVMGDGSARHTEKAPGYLDPRAAPYDGHVGAPRARSRGSRRPARGGSCAVAGPGGGRPGWHAEARGRPLRGAVRRRLPRRDLGLDRDRGRSAVSLRVDGR
jgi:hypothetical protein